MSVKVEEKLYQNRYMVDEGRPHIRIREDDATAGGLRALVHICPAGCWSLQPDGRLSGTLDGCFECGTCRIVASATGQEIEWSYPRGGFGILYKFG